MSRLNEIVAMCESIDNVLNIGEVSFLDLAPAEEERASEILDVCHSIRDIKAQPHALQSPPALALDLSKAKDQNEALSRQLESMQQQLERSEVRDPLADRCPCTR